MKRRTFFRNTAIALLFASALAVPRPVSALAQDGVSRASGILTAKGDAWIEVKADGEKRARRLIPRFIAALPPRQGGLDHVMLAKFTELVVGNRVNLLWTVDEALRVVDIAQVAPRGREGKVTGTVDEAGRGFIDVLPDDEDGVLERYYPQWIDDGNGGALDAEMLKKLATLKAGDRVTVEWTYDERKRAVEVTKLPAATKEQE
jgi:hypothetical protein